jgi:hypothetical protein
VRNFRLTSLAVALCLALPSALAAAQACGMAACAPKASGHDCCPQPEARLEADCCLEAGEAPAEPPAQAPERAGSQASLAAVVPAATLPAARPLEVAPPEPAASPPRDLLARHCILRI